MPEICRFYGIVISMGFVDHPPPHFHAVYGEYEASIAIKGAVAIRGTLPPRAMRLVVLWTRLHRDELMADWDLAVSERPLRRIDPLE